MTESARVPPRHAADAGGVCGERGGGVAPAWIKVQENFVIEFSKVRGKPQRTHKIPSLQPTVRKKKCSM